MRFPNLGPFATQRCSGCHHQLSRLFVLDRTEVRLCGACVRHVVEEGGALLEERDRLYEGASWTEWATAHARHAEEPCIGCPLCGMAVAD